jgi:hypothetical protein
MFRCTLWRKLAPVTPLIWAIVANGCSRAEADSQIRDSVTRSIGFGQVSWEQYTVPPAQTPAPGTDLDSLRQNLPLLAQHKLALVLQWPSSELDVPARWDLVQSAVDMGIAVQLWLTLPVSEPGDEDPSSPNYASTGYFPNATNAEAWCTAARALMDAWQARGLPPTTLVVDFEMRRERLSQFVALSAQSDLFGTLALLEENRAQLGAAGFARAKQRYLDLLDNAHQRGFRVTVTTVLPLLDDFDQLGIGQADNDALRQGFQVPLDPSMPWDNISFQVQRTVYQSYGPTAYFVYYYARQARALFGQRAGVGLGVTDSGWAVDTAKYASGDELRQDVEAALAAGIEQSEINVYSFAGIYKAGPSGKANPAQWLQPVTPHAPGWAPFPDTATPIIQALQRSLRSLL